MDILDMICLGANSQAADVAKQKSIPTSEPRNKKIALTGCLIGILIYSGLLYLCFIPTQLGRISSPIYP